MVNVFQVTVICIVIEPIVTKLTADVYVVVHRSLCHPSRPSPCSHFFITPSCPSLTTGSLSFTSSPTSRSWTSAKSRTRYRVVLSFVELPIKKRWTVCTPQVQTTTNVTLTIFFKIIYLSNIVHIIR